eukprot:TRINITY_DN484_c0_g1_i1.p1 TRINITY_DN484_c0_g1~~TRINITY_DN484_c0_g1_i1.p1  ORF type:complete len:339 (+),score=47.95 TRINITY_DN484_c0_g1_i1:147-1163(+)
MRAVVVATLLVVVLGLIVAVAASSSPTIELGLSVRGSVITLAVYNPSADTAVSVLKYNTPLEDTLFGNCFEILPILDNVDGATEVAYVGKVARRAWPVVSNDSFAIVQPQSKVAGSVDLIEHYAFPSAGQYLVRFRPSSLYPFDSIESPAPVVVTINAPSVPSHYPAPESTNCNANELSQVSTAVAGAKRESSASYSCMSRGSCSSLETTWFGAYLKSRHDYDQGMFQSIYNRLNGYAFNAYCNPSGCGSNVYAYVYPSDAKFTVYLCGLFWSLPAERINTVVHEMSHFTALGGTDDYAYGKSACLSLAKRNPAQAARNADNVCYFSEAATTLLMSSS